MKENIFRLSEELLERKDFRALKQLLAGIAPHTLARLIEGADETDAPLIFRILPKETAAETFVELDEMCIRDRRRPTNLPDTEYACAPGFTALRLHTARSARRKTVRCA